MAVLALALEREVQAAAAGVVGGPAAEIAAAEVMGDDNAAAAADAPALPPALRRKTLAEFKANPPCSFFTPPHRCIVCLTCTHAPSLVMSTQMLVF